MFYYYVNYSHVNLNHSLGQSVPIPTKWDRIHLLCSPKLILGVCIITGHKIFCALEESNQNREQNANCLLTAWLLCNRLHPLPGEELEIMGTGDNTVAPATFF